LASRLELLAVRTALPEECGTVASILAEAFEPYRSQYTPAAFQATTLSADQVRTRLEEGPVWLAFLTGVPVGTLSAMYRSGSLYLRSLAVVPTAQRIGVARALIAEAEGFARSAGIGHMWLTTTPFLTGATELYKRAGFRPSPHPIEPLFGTALLRLEKGVV
jgi:GNAT superfamily N-acetyltransferase